MNTIIIEKIQKRIEEIKQVDKKCLYEIANEIGISEYTLYRALKESQMSNDAENKITAYLNGYLTKDERLEAYRLDNEELKANLEKLKEQNDLQRRELKGYHCQERFPGQCHCAARCLGNEFCISADKKINELQEENARLKEEITQSQCPFFFKHTGICLGRKDEMFKYERCSSHHNCNIKQMAQDNKKYKQTLQEIKEIAEDAYENDSEYQATGIYNEILQKISEVLNEG